MSYLVYMKEALGNLLKPPVTSKYPIEPRKPVAGDRGRVVNDITKCILCGMCERSCPADAIHVDRKNGTWTINPFSCVQCANCVANCPKKCLSMAPEYTQPDTKKSEIILTVKQEEGKKETQRKVEALHPSAMAKALDDRSHVVNNMLKCIFCGMCMRNCPAGAITVDRRTRMWRIDLSACVNCGTCIDNCPRKCLSLGCYLGNKTEVTLYGPAPRRPARRPASKNVSVPPSGEKVVAPATKGGPLSPTEEKPTFQGQVLRTQPAERPKPPEAGVPSPASAAPKTIEPKSEVRASVKPNPVEPKAAATTEPAESKPAPSGPPLVAGATTFPPQAGAHSAEPQDVPLSDNPTHVRNDIDRCLFCGKCEHNCPAGAIKLDRRARTWTIDREKCITCGVCVDGCPAHSLSMEDDWAEGENRALVCVMQGKPPVRRPRK